MAYDSSEICAIANFIAMLKEVKQDSRKAIEEIKENGRNALETMPLISIMKEMVNEDCQFIIATHSPILMAFPEAEILSIEDGVIRNAQYSELEHVQITRGFLNEPERFLKHL